MRSRPWSEVAANSLTRVQGVLTDIDDTLTREGAIEPVALEALQRLADRGVPVIAITGRPMGWSEPFARAWPITAIVAENGAVALFREDQTLKVEYAQDEPTRARHAQRLNSVLLRIQAEVPGATPACDSAGRVTDIAIDHSEFAHLDPAAIARVLALMRSEGMSASVSSIHINGWFGEHTKLSGARWIVGRLFKRDLETELDRWVYVGDSTNDQEMFGHFALSIGVANLLRFERELTVWPAYLTRGARGTGFSEVAETLLSLQS